MFKLQVVPLLLLIISVALAPAYALVSMKTTVSAGYNKDIYKKSHSTVLFNWKYTHLYSNGVETVSDLDINNNFVQEKWGVYPFQLFVSIPLQKTATADYGSRLQLGRQVITEGFDFELIDGAFITIRPKDKYGLSLFGGAIHRPEDTGTRKDDQIYGASGIIKHWGTIAKIGPTLKIRDDKKRQLAHLSLMKSFDSLFLTPTLLVREEWKIDNFSHQQEEAELQLFLDDIYLNIFYSLKNPDPLLQPERKFIYKLFSSSKQTTVGSSISWQYNHHLEASTRAEKIYYHSPASKETGDLNEVTLQISFGNSALTPSVTRVISYGGTVWDFGCAYKYNITDNIDLRVNGDVAHLEKLNNIDGWAYHARSGINLRFISRWELLIATEIERNHIFAMDNRITAYATHFYH